MTRGRKAIAHQFVGDDETKWCGACKAFLPLGSFGKDHDNWDGLVSRCRSCIRIYDNAYEARRRASGAKSKTIILPSTRYLRVAFMASGYRVHVRLYRIWRAMRRRCYQTNHRDYPVYGARGITVCDEWNKSYDAFRSWAVSHGYAKDLTIDRVDGNGNYEPNNCRWATRQEQTYNTKSVHKLTLNGVTKLLPIWAKELGFSPFLLRTRRSSGWSDEQILTTPLLTNGQSRPGVLRGRASAKAKRLASNQTASQE